MGSDPRGRGICRAEALGRRPALNPQPAPTASALGVNASGQKSGGKAGLACSRSGEMANLFGLFCQDCDVVVAGDVAGRHAMSAVRADKST